MKNLDFDWLTDEFMLYCRSTQLREKTMSSYEQTLHLFGRWCADELKIYTVDKITENVIRKYMLWLPMIIMLACFVAVRQVYLFAVTRFVANTPLLVGFGYPVGWVSCCVVELTYFFLRWHKKVPEAILKNNGSL